MQTSQPGDNRVTSSQSGSPVSAAQSRGELWASTLCGVSMSQTVIRGTGGRPLLPDVLRRVQTAKLDAAAGPPLLRTGQHRTPLVLQHLCTASSLRGRPAWGPRNGLRGACAAGKGAGARGQARGRASVSEARGLRTHLEPDSVVCAHACARVCTCVPLEPKFCLTAALTGAPQLDGHLAPRAPRALPPPWCAEGE